MYYYHHNQYPIAVYPYYNNSYYHQIYYRQPLHHEFWEDDVIDEQNYLTEGYDLYNQFGSLEADYLNTQGYTAREPVQYLIPVNDLQNLKGKKIRTTVPNIPGTIIATVGSYNPQTNRVQLINIRSERTGISYGNLSYLPEELSGLEELSGPGSTTGPDSSTPGSQDCSVTGGKGKYIDSGSQTIEGYPIKWSVYECQLEIKVGRDSYILNRQNNGISFEIPSNIPLNRGKGSIFVQNKTLWIDIEYQYQNPFTKKWRRIGGFKTKLGSWAGLKF